VCYKDEQLTLEVPIYMNDIENILRSVLKEELAPINDRLENIESKIDGITEQVAKNAETVTDIKDNLRIISSTIKNQEETINILSRRSIDQEAKIKSIK